MVCIIFQTFFLKRLSLKIEYYFLFYIFSFSLSLFRLSSSFQLKATQASAKAKKRCSQPCAIAASTIETVKIRSDRLDVDFLVCVQDETEKSIEVRTFIMTVHDLGSDCRIFSIFHSLTTLKQTKLASSFVFPFFFHLDDKQLDTSFLDFIACNEMKGLRERVVWIHVNLPGQEANAEDILVE